MAESKAQAWADAKRDVLLALDIEQECRALGVRFTKDRPTAKGWLDCLSIDRTEEHASAAVNVSDGPTRGIYTDRGAGVVRPACGFWDIPIRLNRLPDFKTVLLYYAQRTGVKLPGEVEERDIDKIDFSPLTPGATMLYCAGKNPPGQSVITPAGIIAAGGVVARVNKKLPPEKQQVLICVPVFGPAMLDLEPIGYHGCPQNPKLKFNLYQGEGKEPKKIKVYSIGEAGGLMGLDTLRRWDEIKVVTVCEGITDLFAMQSALVADGVRDHGCLALAGASVRLGAEYLHHFAGKECVVAFDVGDEDGAGDTGAAVLTTMLTPVCERVYNFKLPPGADGKCDIRRYFAEA